MTQNAGLFLENLFNYFDRGVSLHGKHPMLQLGACTCFGQIEGSWGEKYECCFSGAVTACNRASYISHVLLLWILIALIWAVYHDAKTVKFFKNDWGLALALTFQVPLLVARIVYLRNFGG